MTTESKMQKTGQMFTVQVELPMYFGPFMEEHGDGIRLFRPYQLPFPPYPGLTLWNESFRVVKQGYRIEAVAWNPDMNWFEADLERESVPIPMDDIPIKLSEYRWCGWSIKYSNDYTFKNCIAAASVASQEKHTNDDEWDDYVASENPNTRSEKFNDFIKAFVRLMVDARNNLSTAYAIDQTGWYFEEKPADPKLHKSWRKWDAARWQFGHLTEEQQRRWFERTERYLDMNSVLAERPAESN